MASFPRSQSPGSRPRVVITGAGVVTAHGLGWQVNAEGFRAGRASFRPVTLFDVSRHRARVAAEVDLPAGLPETRLGRRRQGRLDRATRMLLWAGHEAFRQAALEPPAALPVVIGTTSGGMSLGEAYYRQAIRMPRGQRQQPTRVIQYLAQVQVGLLSESLGCSGPVTIIANACASGANAIGHAWDLIRAGVADRVVTGGYDALCELVFTGFDSLQALSTTQCRPFDAQRDGLALGEGAAILILETIESAQRRGAPILGEIVGYGAATDVHHLTQPHPEGRAARLSMEDACRTAGVRPEQIGYINAHGTGTSLNDASEAGAINTWAGDRVGQIPVSSTKAGIGHLLGAAGAVEVVVCAMALQGQWLPPVTALRTPDPACRFPLITAPTDAAFDCALSNSFGFGGANASLILRRFA